MQIHDNHDDFGEDPYDVGLRPLSVGAKTMEECGDVFDNVYMIVIRVIDYDIHDGMWAAAGLHKLWYPSIRDTSTWSKFGAHGEHRDVFLFSNLGAL